MLSVDFPPPQICQFQLVMDTHLSNHELKSVENYFSVIKSSTGSAFQKDKCEHPPSYLGLGCGLLRAYGVFSLKGRFHCYVFSKNPFTFPIKELWRADAMLCSRLNSGQVQAANSCPAHSHLLKQDRLPIASPGTTTLSEPSSSPHPTANQR